MRSRSQSVRTWPKGALLVSLFAIACGSGAAVVRTGPHRPSEEPPPKRVSSAPPPPKVETLPLRRNSKCFFRDGEWTPSGRAWKWEKGEWILPPPGCYYAPPQTRYEDLDVGPALVFRKGVWLSTLARGAKCTNPKPCPVAAEN